MSTRVRKLGTRYYRQFDADYSLSLPAMGYGGWDEAELPLDLDLTALVVMHAWDAGTVEEYPGWYRAVEYLPRANAISERVLPDLLSAARDAHLSVLHVVGGSDYYSEQAGYKRAAALAPDDADTAHTVTGDPTYDELKRFRLRNVFPGEHNDADIRRGQERMSFNRYATPLAGEGVAATADQLDALCRDLGVNHLVYVGFAIDGCLLISPGGMVDMHRRGYLCSTIAECVTAIENRESIRGERAKALALWRVALLFGFVYELDEFLRMLLEDPDGQE